MLALVADGDENAFRTVFNKYWKKIYSVAFTFTKSPVLSEELVQDIFLKIWINKKELPAIKKFDDYLFTIARNHIYNELRKKTMEQPFVEHLEQHFLEAYYLPEQLLMLKETTGLINTAVEKLPDQQRVVFKLSRNDGLDYNSIAQQLGITRSTVKNHMTKALEFLRNYLVMHVGKLIFAVIVIKDLW